MRKIAMLTLPTLLLASSGCAHIATALGCAAPLVTLGHAPDPTDYASAAACLLVGVAKNIAEADGPEAAPVATEISAHELEVGQALERAALLAQAAKDHPSAAANIARNNAARQCTKLARE